jgi:hypothetical protein
LNPNDDNTIRQYFTDAYASDGGTCYCCVCGEVQEFQVLDVTDEKTDPWRCEVCGSSDVQQQAWVNPTTGKVVSYNDCDRGDYWCEHCEEHEHIVRESELMDTIEDWFANHLLPDDDEVISGLNSDDYASEEEYAAACKELWNACDNESKIHIWHELTRDKSNDD